VETGGAAHRVLKRRELPGVVIVNENKRPHPWDTHYQFSSSIKTLLSKGQNPLSHLTYAKIGRWRAHKKAQKLKMLRSQGRYV